MELRRQKSFRIIFLTVAIAASFVSTSAQVATPPPPPQKAPTASVPQPRTRVARRSTAVVIKSRNAAPQVVTILHRLNGLKMFRLLMRSGEEIGAISKLDEAFRMKDEVHTSVIAGLALDDGETIAARLPEATAELDPTLAPSAPPSPSSALAPFSPTSSMGFPGGEGSSPMAGQGLLAGGGNWFDRPDVTVIGRDGKRLAARYIGLDGVTGISVLQLAGHNALGSAPKKDPNVIVGQGLRLLGPEPVTHADSRAPGTIYVRIGEIQAKVVSVTCAPSGMMARIKVSSNKLSPANIGGVAINDAGDTVGIIDAVEKNEATLLPSGLVKSAAKRVLERQASVPRPWLGIRGEPLGTFPLEQLTRGGWQLEKARALVQQRGILLTSVAPGSPAAGASLHPGDVILRVNEGEVKNADDFSWSLEEVGAGNSVNFTVARPGNAFTEAVEVTLSDAPVAFSGSTEDEPDGAEINIERILRQSPMAGAPSSVSGLLMSQGIETIALKPTVAARFGAGSGLLVIYVNPRTVAFKSGLRSGDVIEAINGRPVLSEAIRSSLDASSYSLNIVRNKEKVVVKVAGQ